MQPMNENDLTKIAAALSGPNGLFGADNLVCYGMTTIVKPGAATDEGVHVTGAVVQAALGADYQVFPMAVEYGPDPFQQSLAELDEDLDSLEDSLEAPEAFGGQKGLRRRYLSVVARYRKCMTKQQIKDKRKRTRRCARRFRRMMKIWQRMSRKGFTSGLKSPMQVRAEFRAPARQAVRPAVAVRRPVMIRPARRVVRAPVARPAPAPAPQPAATYVPTSQEVSPYYFADQAALEREWAANMPSYGEDQDELSADLRCDSTGYLYGGIEHDYFGIGGNAELVLSEEDQADVEFGAGWSDAGFLLAGVSHSEDDALGEDDEDLLAGVEEEISDAELGDDDLDDELGDDDLDDELGDDDLLWDGDDLVDSDDDDEEAEVYGNAVEDLEGQIQSAILSSGASKWTLLKKKAELQNLMDQHDEIVKKGGDPSTVDAKMRQILLDAGAHPSSEAHIQSLVAKRDALLVQTISGAFAGDEMGGVRMMVARARRQLERRGEISPRLSKRLNNKRAKLQNRLSRARNPQRIQSRIAMISAVLAEGSSNAGVDYGRVQPKTPGSDAAPVVVIAIRKRGGELASQRNQAVGEYGAAFGYHTPNPGLADVFAAHLYAANQGYSPLEALSQHQSAVDATTLVHGSENWRHAARRQAAKRRGYESREEAYEARLGYDDLAEGPEDLATFGLLGAEEDLAFEESYGAEAPFPMGAEAPFPGPRAEGPEVY